MHRLGRRSIQSGIFWVVTVIAASVLALAVTLYLLTTARTLRANCIVTSNQMAKLLSARLDTAVRQVDSLQVRIIESEAVRDYVFSDFAAARFTGDIYTKQRLFEQEIFTIAGYDYPFYNLSILTQTGELLYFGRQYSFAHPEEPPPGWADYYADISARRGYKYLAPLNAEKLYHEAPSVAVCRSFSRYPLNEHRAVMELQIADATLRDLVDATLLSYQNHSNQVVVFDEAGAPVYPAGLDGAELSHYVAAPTDARTVNPATGAAELVSRFSSGYTGWTVAVVTPYAATLAGFGRYAAYAVLIGALGLAVALAVAFRVSKTISAPIISIKESLLAVNLDTLRETPGEDVRSGFNELALLQGSVEEMRTKLERSLNDYVRMRSLSIHSRMLALQSQMNPHFLYNTLSIMAILAEENGDDEVSGMCRRLSAMLRYTSTEREYATLRQELEHTRQYGELMRVRFGDGVQLSYDIDDALLDVQVPPILLQPLVENSVKYARGGESPLCIHVRAFGGEGRWYIEVSDNGTGFSDAALAEIWDKIEKKTEWEKIMQRQVEGVGLANLYLRMQLFYDGEFVFRMENRNGGACITVGGAPDHTEGKRNA